MFGVRQGVDLIAASFVRKPDDVRSIKEVLGHEESFMSFRFFELPT